MIEGLEHEFESEGQQVIREGAGRPSQGFYWIGACLILIGVIMMLIGLFKSGAPEYSDTLNIGLLNDKTNLVTGGGLLSVAGTLFVCSRYLAGRLHDALSGVPR